jgi:predicted nucleic acid-binding protein
MVGLDTGFFVGLMKGKRKAAEVWHNLSQAEFLPVVSVLTLGELLYLSFRLGEPETGRTLVDNIAVATKVVAVDRDIVEKGASLKAGRGIPYVDALIAATFLLSGCKEIHTTDKAHFGELEHKDLALVFY